MGQQMMGMPGQTGGMTQYLANGTAAAALHYFAVANEIRLGAALMVLFAYLYYFTSFWLVVV